MINKRKFRVIEEVADWDNSSPILDLREIARIQQEKEKKIKEKNLVNLKLVKKNGENRESEIKKIQEQENLPLFTFQQAGKKIVEQKNVKESKLVSINSKQSFFDTWWKKRLEVKKQKRKEFEDRKRLRLKKQVEEQELKKAVLLQKQQLNLKKQLEKKELKKQKLFAKQKEKEDKRLKIEALKQKRLIEKQQVKLRRQIDKKSLKEKKKLEEQRLQLAIIAKKKELKNKQIAFKREQELNRKLEREELEQKKIIAKQLERQEKSKVDYWLLFRNRLDKGWGFSIIGFIFMGFVLFSGIKGLDYFNTQAHETKSKILGDAGVAYQYISSATGSVTDKDFTMASYKFGVAADRFLNARSDLNQYGEVVTSVLKVLPGASAVRSGDNLLAAGANLSKAGEYLTQAVTPLNDLGSFIKIGGEKDNKTSLTEVLADSINNLRLAVEKIDQTNEDLKKVDVNDLPQDVRVNISLIKENLPKINNDLKILIGYSDNFLEILGHKGSKRYLVLFENNRELRPTGGFMGTYALVDIADGQIKNLKIEGPYNLDGNLYEKIIAPEPLRLIQVKFFLRDANWFLDFPMSAKKIMSMYEKSGGPTVDGVFTVTGNVMEALLDVMGEIDMPEYDTKINSANFFDETQWEVEYDYDKELNEPKKFLADLFPIFLDRLTNLNKNKWPDALNAIYKMLEQKDIMMYFNDEKIENFVKEFNWTGEIKQTTKDYLSVVTTNIGGGKTDHIIDQKILHEAEILEDGSIVNTVTITRIHNGDPNDFWTSIKNMAYMRVYVPLGSEMLEAKGFDKEFWGVLRPLEEGSVPDSLISDIESNMKVNNENGIRIMQEDGKTVFGNWMGVECGQVKTVMIKYKLPFNIKTMGLDPALSYGLFLQKQPGTKAFEISSILKYPRSFYVNWKYSSDNLLTEVADGLQYRTNLNKDKAYAVVFVK